MHFTMATVYLAVGALATYATLSARLHFEDHSGLHWIRWGQVNVLRPPGVTGAKKSRALQDFLSPDA